MLLSSICRIPSLPLQRDLTDSKDSGPDFGIPSAYYVCAPRGANTLNPSPNTRSYPRIQIHQALAEAFILADAERVIRARNGRTYPERFIARGSDIARFGIPTNDRRINANRLLEFPIIRNDFGQYIPFAEVCFDVPTLPHVLRC